MRRDGTTLVGVTFSDDPPETLPVVRASSKYCGFVGRARQGESFCVPRESISCPLARFHMGIDRADVRQLARTLVAWSDAVDVETGTVFLDNADRLAGDFSFISFLAFPEPEVEPDLLIAQCSADAGQSIVQSFSAQTGQRMAAPVSGIGAACGECTSYVLSQRAPTVSLGCNGSRPNIALQSGELLLAAVPDSPMGELLRRRG